MSRPSERRPMPSNSRRAILGAIGAAAVGLAGCQEQTGSSPTDESTPTITATPSPTDSPTPTPLRCEPVPGPDATWPVSRRSAANDGFLETGAALDEPPSVDWTVDPTVPEDVDADPRDAEFGRPVVADDSVYLLRRIAYGPMVDDPGGHAIQARDATTGEREWSYRLPMLPSAPVAVRGDAVLAASWNEQLYAVDRRDGSERWTREFEGLVDAVVPTSYSIYVHRSGSASRDSELHALAPDGTTRWSAGDDGIQLFAVGTDHVYVSFEGGTLSALARADGTELWRATIPGDDGEGGARNVVDVVVTDCAVFALAGGGVHAFDREGHHRFRARGSYYTLATDGASLYGASKYDDERTLRAIDAGSGDTRWEQPLAVRSLETGIPTGGPPALTDGTLYQPLDDGLAGVDRADGDVVWRTTPGLVTLAVGSDAIYGLDEGVRGASLVAMR